MTAKISRAPTPRALPIGAERNNVQPLNDEQAICARLKNLRTNSGLTLEALAARSGFTKGYLSKIENGKKAPPIASLARIARAMEQDLSYFFVDSRPIEEFDSAPSNARVSVVHRWERKPVVRGGTAFGYDYVSLAHKKTNKHMEPFIFTFPSEVDINTYFEHPGEEFLYIMTGKVEFVVKIDGKLHNWTLEAGDSIYFESNLAHRGRSLSGDAQAMVVVMEAPIA